MKKQSFITSEYASKHFYICNTVMMTLSPDSLFSFYVGQCGHVKQGMSHEWHRHFLFMLLLWWTVSGFTRRSVSPCVTFVDVSLKCHMYSKHANLGKYRMPCLYDFMFKNNGPLVQICIPSHVFRSKTQNSHRL